MPLFPGGAISIRNEVEVPNCPPSEKPCRQPRNHDDRRRGDADLAVGTAFGVLLTQLYTPEQLAAGLSRIPFAFGVIILPVTWYIRRYLQAESHVFVALQQERARTPGQGIGEGLRRRHVASSGQHRHDRRQRGVVLRGLRLYRDLRQGRAASSGRQRFCRRTGGRLPDAGGDPDRRHAVCDRFAPARKQMLVGFLAIYFLLMYPAYAWLAAAPTIPKLVIVQLAISVVSGLFLGVYCTTMSELFPPRIRSTSLSIANNVSVLIFGLAQFFLTWTCKLTGSQIAPVYYVMFGIALGLVGALFMPRANAAEG